MAYTLVVNPKDLSEGITRLGSDYHEAGGFADVHSCHYKSNHRTIEVAVKVFRFELHLARQKKTHSEKRAKLIRREIGIWKRVRHPNIVPFLGIAYRFGREGNASLVSLWMTNGSLCRFLDRYGDHLMDAHCLQLLLDISKGLSYLHSFSESTPIVHGDLSPANVLLDDDYTAHLVDFGFASAVGDLPEALGYLQKSTTGPGAVRWATPEHFAESYIKCTPESDIYSLGNLVFLVLSGRFPWSEVPNDCAVMRLLSQGGKPARPELRQIREDHWALIEWCWSSIAGRPCANDVMLSLQSFLLSYPTPEPLYDLLGSLSLGASPDSTLDDMDDMSDVSD